MCNMFSAIALQTGELIYNDATDLHEDLIEAYNLRDSDKKINFARVGYYPPSQDMDDYFDIDKYKLFLDEDRAPDWYEAHKEDIERKFRNIIKKKILISQTGKTLLGGRYLMKNCEYKAIKNCVVIYMENSRVGELRENSQVGVLRENSRVGVLRDSSQVGVLRENSRVGELRGNSRVGVLRENSQVGALSGNSRVGELRGNSRVGVLRNSSQVGVLSGNSRVGELWGNSRVGVLRNNSQVGEMWGNSRVGVLWENSKIINDYRDK